MQFPEDLVILPLESKVLLPSVVLRLTIRGKEASELVKTYFKHSQNSSIYIACIPLLPFKKKETNPDVAMNIASQAPQVPVTPTVNPDGIKEDGLILWKDKKRLMKYGCVARITRVQRSGTNLFGVFVEGLGRFRVNQVYERDLPPAKHWANVSYYPDIIDADDHDIEKFKELGQAFVSRMRKLKLPDALLEPLTKLVNNKPVPFLVDLFSSLIETTFEEKLKMLSSPTLKCRIHMMNDWIIRQLHVLQLTDTIGMGVEGSLSKRQREFYLRQQLEAIQEELKGNSRSESLIAEGDELSDLYKKLAEARLPNDALIAAQRELKRMKHLQPASSEYGVARHYLEWMSDLPWNQFTQDNLNLQKVKHVLDSDHFGLNIVKKRIIEYLSVIKVKDDLKAPILCLVGPPGVGKTSLGVSIARSMSRHFHRISLGGVHDEAEIRGHRRTYVGAMPGVIIQGLRKSRVKNPLFLLDEIDKLASSSHHGDPAAALLEVLDPEQNDTFTDHYLNVPFDLSNILFVATANSLDTIPEPLLDRMEVIELHGYTFDEKLYIAKTYLIPKQINAHGLELQHIQISDDTILRIAESYTRESGVRNLERMLASVIRAKCVQLAELKEGGEEGLYDSRVTVEDISQILGNVKFEKEVFERNPCPGVVIGLAYSGSGHGGIMFVEATKMPGSGKLHLTGSLGNVLQESAQIALSWVKANAFGLGLTLHPKERLAKDDDIHIHLPHGSIPKDGPSAGITLICALVSLYSNKCIPTTVAMTGEISLRGQVLPVGGIKEKVISAHRAGIRKIIIPFRNKRDVEATVPETVQADIVFSFVQDIWQMLHVAFENEKWSAQSRRNMMESRL
ncbi:hypothetical protein G6F70_007544 [Rhizopus microsporus]|nr:hypothetical protein G6F71_007500 [Rhizopus microsporus]KAG1196313.1 hypothetical protein G6F70_007544 [Rhizopus microsporus]KAG1208093.1 hypothetical protein G6F69_007509 [Rhizopus microsporus]KAG1229217.1 hypothetical protein G6F67_007302 [Rhizopus microsporus]KAG1261238.1 hypothetical protein G6F68_006834 [Rhizopus microsporus]